MPCAIMRPLVFKLLCYRYLAFDMALSLSLWMKPANSFFDLVASRALSKWNLFGSPSGKQRKQAYTRIVKVKKMHFMRNARASSFSLGAPGQETPWAEWVTTPRTIDSSEHPFFAPREWSWRRRLCTGRQEAPLPRWRTHARCVFFDGSTSRLVAFAAAATNGHCGKLFA
jgi:hypothetical protein